MFQIFMFESVLKIQSMLKSVMHVESILKKSVENYKKSMLKFSACSENCKKAC